MLHRDFWPPAAETPPSFVVGAMTHRAFAMLLAVALSLASVMAGARPSAPQEHRVYPGQHLGMIAKRYNVTVDAICHANDVARKSALRPGQTLLIPPPDDPDGSKTRKIAQQRNDGPAATPKGAKRRAPTRKQEKRATGRPLRPPRVHEVARGQHLGMIARRYRVSVEALCHANSIERKSPIRPGQRLYVPWPEDEQGQAARRHAHTHPIDAALPDPERQRRGDQGNRNARRGRQAGRPSWEAYRRPPWRRGFVELRGLNGTWRGYVIGKGNKVLGGARLAFGRILATSDGRTIKIHPRLVRLIAKVSDTFGGRPIRVVSGYRLESTARRSRHKTGSALDFSIAGVPNEALRDYVKTFSKVGVGYYPNSHFIHLDVRDRWTYWIDYSGPGQAPRYAGVTTKKKRRR